MLKVMRDIAFTSDSIPEALAKSPDDSAELIKSLDGRHGGECKSFRDICLLIGLATVMTSMASVVVLSKTENN